jgi:septum formation protein
MKKLILASGSPRRKEILENAGYEFDVVPAEFEEDLSLDMPPHELARHLSQGKAWDVARGNYDAVVLAADTLIAFEGHILGKPHTPDEARRMLRTLSGRTHSVITGFTVMEGEHAVTRSVETTVTFRALSDGDVEDYIDTGEPLDKAGAYAIQEQGASLVEKVEGDYLNVVGLPLENVKTELEKFGIFGRIVL